MAFTQAEKDRFNKACKQNYHQYNKRISELERMGKESSEYVKTIRSIQQIQKELAAKDENGRPQVSLFGKGPKSTRSQFFARLDSLFKNVNDNNKKSLQARIDSFEVQLNSGQVNPKALLKDMQSLNDQWIIIPAKDPDKKNFKQKLDDLFQKAKAKVKAEKETSLPEAEEQLQNIQKGLEQVKDKLQDLKKLKFSEADFVPNIQALKAIHKPLMGLQKRIHEGQTSLKQAKLPREAFQRYQNKFQRLYQSMQGCWQDERLVEVSNWIEQTSAGNYYHFNRQLEEIESRTEGISNKNQVKQLNAEIKELEAALKEKNSRGYHKKALKFEQRNEIFNRTWACKQVLNDFWQGISRQENKEVQRIQEAIDQVLAQKDRATSKKELEKVKQEIKKLHDMRKKRLEERLLSPGQNYKLNRDINAIWSDVVEIINRIAPAQFSSDWLQEAYFRNLQQGWVIFVNDVPAVMK